MQQPVLAFWYEFASTYSYLAAHRVERLAATADLDVDGAWRDHLLVAVTAEEIQGSAVARLVNHGFARRY